MTDYKGIKGDRVEYIASDPTLTSAEEGQVWYNSTSGTLKSLVKIQAWSSAGNLANARTAFAGCGTQTAALAGGGSPVSAATEEFSDPTLAVQTITTS